MTRYPRLSRRAAPLLSLPFVLLLGLLFGPWCPGSVAAQEKSAGAGDEKAFNEALARAHKFMTRGRWKRALETLDTILEQHAKRDYVRNKRLDVIEIHRRSKFRTEHKAPDPKKVVSGKLQSYNLRSGKLKIEYTDRLGGDFDSGRIKAHGARFDGPHTITLYSTRSCNFDLVVVAGGDAGFHIRSLISKREGRIDIVDRKTEDFDTGFVLPKAIKSKHKLQVKITSRRITVSYNGRRVVSAKKPKDQWGYWGISKRCDRLVVEGKAEPSWLQGKIDKVMTGRQRRFNSRYKPKDFLPAWLFEKTASTKKGGGEFPDPYPVEMDDTQQERFERASAVLDSGSKRRGERVLKRLNDQLPKEAVAYLRALHEVKHGNFTKRVREDLDLVLAKKPGFAPALALRGPYLFQRGQREEGLTDLRAALKAAPDVADLYDTLGIFLLRAGRWEEARETIERGFQVVGRTKDLAERYRTIVKAQNGPSFRVTHQYKTANYHIVSDIDRKTCLAAGRILEDAYRAYNVHLKWAKRRGKVKRFRVFLFSGQAGYLAFTKDLMGVSPKGSAGLFSPLLKQLLIWNLPDRQAMMRTVRHEGFHQYLDRIMHDPPTWLNEGLAEYYETADYRGTGFKTGGIRMDHVRTLRRGFGSVRDFMLDPGGRGFYENPMKNYALAWAVVYTLRHGPAEYRRFFRKLFADLQEARPSRETMTDALKQFDVKGLEERVRSLVRNGALPQN